ncbi:branched chain amino acid aminotransferase [Rhodospirillum rubrum]|uniref:branched-chain amino acid aminotransferase n=2 Tax=Pseudomonadota TaxID=1224 RepID=UPI001906D4E6|nr:branched-chain amino acid aminotransferase [Rhodospirillum rubrum]MBK1664841.1 branched chain amino acid aminotransferase [Rhodospirillum rubrum]MBK1677113.1 branched chain amino acid aminotransferase [Rhodospirillum rubrum]
MSTPRKTWTYYKGDWHEGDIRILGAASHATWLGSLVFDGARAFEGVTPDLDRHSARINESARALLLKPTLDAETIIGLTHDGLAKFDRDAAVYIRPMYWAEDSDSSVVGPDPESTDFALCLEEHPMTEPTGFTITTTRFRRPSLEVMPVNAKAACLYANNARMLREARARGFHNALVCDMLGNVAELATANVFLARGGEVFTSVANGTFLAGITRSRIIGLLREAGVTVHEMTLSVEDFREADEIFSTGNISKVVPVIGFDDKTFAYGPLARKARALYWEWAHR